jgi:hypothetical protein
VTAFDPDSASEPDTGADQFPVVLRGYDRQLVDTRLGELAEQLEEERRQRADAEQRLHQLDTGNALAVRDQPTASFLSLGARAAKVFEEAGAVAERLIGEAHEQARLITDAAQAEAAERLKAAEEQASQLEQAARDTLARRRPSRPGLRPRRPRRSWPMQSAMPGRRGRRRRRRSGVPGKGRTASGCWLRPRPSGCRRFGRS